MMINCDRNRIAINQMCREEGGMDCCVSCIRFDLFCTYSGRDSFVSFPCKESLVSNACLCFFLVFQLLRIFWPHLCLHIFSMAFMVAIFTKKVVESKKEKKHSFLTTLPPPSVWLGTWLFWQPFGPRLLPSDIFLVTWHRRLSLLSMETAFFQPQVSGEKHANFLQEIAYAHDLREKSPTSIGRAIRKERVWTRRRKVIRTFPGVFRVFIHLSSSSLVAHSTCPGQKTRCVQVARLHVQASERGLLQKTLGHRHCLHLRLYLDVWVCPKTGRVFHETAGEDSLLPILAEAAWLFVNRQFKHQTLVAT